MEVFQLIILSSKPSYRCYAYFGTKITFYSCADIPFFFGYVIFQKNRPSDEEVSLTEEKDPTVFVQTSWPPGLFSLEGPTKLGPWRNEGYT